MADTKDKVKNAIDTAADKTKDAVDKTSAKAQDAAIRSVERRPERIVVVDMAGEAEHCRVGRKARGRAHKMAEVGDRHDRIDRRDQRRPTGQPGGDQLKARVRRGRRAHDHVEVKILPVVVEPLPAIVALFVDDDRDSVNAHGAKTFEGVVDQGPAGDLDQGLGPVVGQRAHARAEPGGQHHGGLGGLAHERASAGT